MDIEFDIYPGFPESEHLLEAAETLGVARRQIAIIRFKGEFYGVAFDSYSRMVIIGLDTVWYRGTQGCFLAVLREGFVLPYPMNKGLMAKEINQGLVTELLKVYPDITISRMRKVRLVEEYTEELLFCRDDCPRYPLGLLHLVLLGVSFCANEIPVDGDLSLHDRFFSPGPTRDAVTAGIIRNPKVKAFNPFRNYVVGHQEERAPYAVQFTGYPFVETRVEIRW